MLVAVLTFTAASILVDVPVENLHVLLPGLLLVGFFFAQLGVLIGVRGRAVRRRVVRPDLRAHPADLPRRRVLLGLAAARAFETLTQFPVYYMIGLVRYGFLGYSEANVALALAALTVATAALFALNHHLFRIGYKLRA